MERPPRRKATPSIQTTQTIKLGKPIEVSWAAVLESRVEAANAFYVQLVTDQKGQPAELILNAGFLPPAPTWGELPQQLAQANAISSVSVQPVVRLAISLGRGRELRDVLDSIVKALDQSS